MKSDIRVKTSLIKYFVLVVLVLGLVKCGIIIEDKDIKKYDDAHDGKLSENVKSEKEAKTELNSSSTSIVPIECKKDLNALQLANKATQNLFGRGLNPEERTEVLKADFSYEKFVDGMLASGESTNGITNFLTALFNLSNIRVPEDLDDDEIADEAQLVSDLQKEPIELVLRNITKPWKWFFTTRDIFCTKNTAKIYNYSEQDSGAFVNCRLPEDRAGFLGLASVLRSHPSSVVSTNNNYHRVAFAMYLSQGFILLDATDGPKGKDSKGLALAACVPKTDMRIDPNGLVYGTAVVPSQGATCASCHSRYNAPLSIPFRRFKEDGSTYSFGELDGMNNNVFTALGTTRDEVKSLINEQESCWSHDGVSPSQRFTGVQGLGRLIAEADTLGEALGVQIPKHLGNVKPDPNMSSTIKKYYEDNDQTLPSAIKGYLVSDSFRCAVKGE